MTHMTHMKQSGPSDAPTIEVLYFDGCPNHERAVALVRQALAAEQIVAPIQMIRIATHARVYPTADGHVAPVPAYEALVAALRRE